MFKNTFCFYQLYECNVFLDVVCMYKPAIIKVFLFMPPQPRPARGIECSGCPEVKVTDFEILCLSFRIYLLKL